MLMFASLKFHLMEGHWLLTLLRMISGVCDTCLGNCPCSPQHSRCRAVVLCMTSWKPQFFEIQVWDFFSTVRLLWETIELLIKGDNRELCLQQFFKVDSFFSSDVEELK